MEIEEIIRKLFGYINPIGETTEDNRRYENLINYKKIINYVIDELAECARYKNSIQYSEQRSGEKAFDILEENLEYIKDVLNEINDEEIN